MGTSPSSSSSRDRPPPLREPGSPTHAAYQAPAIVGSSASSSAPARNLDSTDGVVVEMECEETGGNNASSSTSTNAANAVAQDKHNTCWLLDTRIYQLVTAELSF